MQTPRRAEATPTDVPAPPPFFRYRFANVDYDESAGALSVGGVPVDIEPRPRELLSELLRRPNEVVAREELLEALWQGRPTVDNVLANAVTKLRKALGPEGAERLINVPRVGYRLAGPIERVAVGQHAGSLPALIAGERVPGREAYRLEAPLGRGASTALVWRARDPKLQETRVFKFAADSERLTALKREYTLYRVLRAELGERDDFARVLGVNFATAPFFLECEDGGADLLDWADDEGGRLAALSVAARIALFLQIARAVAAAHGVGVLHKDLKPANVLITAEGDGWTTKLTDFGSSRLLEPGRLAALGVTAMGLTVTHGPGPDSPGGTPLYLAPELIAGRSPTTQSDLYALGLMLYQLVAGDLRRPMSTGWQRDIDDALLADDIRAATEGRPEDRLGSVAELVERLQTLEARRQAAALAADAARRVEALRAESDRRRSRRPWVVGALIVLSLGLAASLWFYRQARAALQIAEQQSARANAISEFLSKDVLQSKDVTRDGARKPVLMLEVLRNASMHISERFKGQPIAEAAVRMALGQTFKNLADITNAGAQFYTALALATPRLAADDPLVLRLRLAFADNLMRTMDKSMVQQGVKDVESTLRAAGPALAAGQTELAFLIARADFLRLQQLDRHREAVVPGQRMVALADAVPALDADTRFQARLDLAELHLVLGEQAQAEALLADAARASLGASDASEVAYARAMQTLAWAQAGPDHLERTASALLALSERLALTLGREHIQYGNARNELARAYNELGDARACEQALREALFAYNAAVGNDHQYAKVTESNLAEQLVAQGRDAEALRLLDQIAPWFVAPHTTRRYWALDEGRAGALIGLGRAAEALALLEAIPAAEWAQAGAMRWRMDALRGRALLAVGRRTQAVDLLEAAIRGGEKEGDGPDLAKVRDVLAAARRTSR